MHPFYLFFFYSFGADAGKGKEHHTKEFGVERPGEQPTHA